jgi:hypothetical protein
MSARDSGQLQPARKSQECGLTLRSSVEPRPARAARSQRRGARRRRKGSPSRRAETSRGRREQAEHCSKPVGDGGRVAQASDA